MEMLLFFARKKYLCNKANYNMEQTIKTPYEAPTTEVAEVTTQGSGLVASVDPYESIPW